MARVVYAKDSRTKGYIALGINDGGEIKKLTVSKIEYSCLGSPERGEEIDEGTVEHLMELDEQFRALRRALSFLSYADNSERGLMQKLLRAGYSRDSAELAIKECVRLGYIRELEQLKRLIESYANAKLRGPLYIKAALMQKGYSSRDISEAMSELISTGEIDFGESFRRLLEKYSPSDDEERRMLAKKYGYRSCDCN